MKAIREDAVFDKPYEFLAMWQSADYRRLWKKSTNEEFSRKSVTALWNRCLAFERSVRRNPGPSGAGQDELSQLRRKASLDASHPQTDKESPPLQGGVLQCALKNFS